METERERALSIVASHLEGCSLETRLVLVRIINQIASLSDPAVEMPSREKTLAGLLSLFDFATPDDLRRALQECKADVARTQDCDDETIIE